MRYIALRGTLLRQVRFTDDQRRRAFGRPLDFVFYRGLNVSAFCTGYARFRSQSATR